MPAVTSGIAAPTMPRLTPTARRRRNRTDLPWVGLFLGPMTIGLAIFYLWPIVGTIYTSFTKTGVFGGATWTGVTNYVDIAGTPEVWRALGNTVIYTVIVLGSIPLALLIASLLSARGLRYVGLFRAAFFLPIVTLPVAVAWVWRLLYNGDFGVINAVLHVVGIPGTSWLADGRTALVAVSLVGAWMSIGYPVLLFVAAMQGVPEELHEAAELDGAGPVRRFFTVTIPLVSPTIFFVTVLTVIGALQMFDLIFVMIGDSSPVIPQTETIIYVFYRTAFVNSDRGLASAIVVCLMVVIMLLTALQFRLQRRWVHYE